MKIVAFSVRRGGPVGIGVDQVVKVERLDDDETTITLTDSQSIEVKGSVSDVIAKLNG